MVSKTTFKSMPNWCFINSSPIAFSMGINYPCPNFFSSSKTALISLEINIDGSSNIVVENEFIQTSKQHASCFIKQTLWHLSNNLT
jgi:hypothetical protein